MARIEQDGESVRTISQRRNHLGSIANDLRDLHGIAALAYELIQNADDTDGATYIRFDVQEEALIVENDGLFSDCGEMDAEECPWKEEGEDKPACDFHRFRDIGGRGKMLEEGTSGSFGIGFTAVHQITDRPEVFSGARHWTLYPERREEDRIEERILQPPLTGTRFRLPWAFDSDSAVRKGLGQDALPASYPGDMLNALRRILPDALLFLRRLKRIQLAKDGQDLRLIEALKDGSRALITESAGNDESFEIEWIQFDGNFEEEVQQLRQSPVIEPKRTADVSIAVPRGPARGDGLLYAFLPTEQPSGLPFRLNADFFPKKDRKSVVLTENTEGDWNRTAIRTAGRVFAEALPSLLGHVAPADLWGMIEQTRQVHDDATAGKCDAVFGYCWTLVKEVLQRGSLVFTHKEQWVSPDKVFLLDGVDADALLPALDDLAVAVVHPELRSYRNALLAAGVKRFELPQFIERLKLRGYTKPITVAEAPSWMVKPEELAAVAKAVNEWLRRTSESRRDELLTSLTACTLAPTTSGQVVPLTAARKTDSSVAEALYTIGVDANLLDHRRGASVAPYVEDLLLYEFIQHLENATLSTLQQIWLSDPDAYLDVLRLLIRHEEKVKADSKLKEKLRRVCIWPSENSLHPLTELVIPGGFDDPLGLSTLVDKRIVEALGSFLTSALGVRKLTVDTYAAELVPDVFANHADVSNEDRHLLAGVFAAHIGELADDSHAQNALRLCPIVRCSGGEYRSASEVYFPSTTVREVVGADAPVTARDPERPEAFERLYEWLGVARTPRAEDVVARIRQIVNEPPTPDRREVVSQIIQHLSSHFRTNADVVAYRQLRDFAWLPAKHDQARWYKPSELYAPYSEHLFASQASFLDLYNPTGAAPVIDFLGVASAPSLTQVVSHLLWCTQEKAAPNADIYRYLSNAVSKASKPDEKREVRQQLERLSQKPILFLSGVGFCYPSEVFFSRHPYGRFRHQLDTSLRIYTPLFQAIEVQEEPRVQDAVAVIEDISRAFAHDNRALDEEALSVLEACWRQLSEALPDSSLIDLVGALRDIKCVANDQHLLYAPSDVFLDDIPDLPGKFRDYLSHNLIPRNPATAPSLEIAGVRSTAAVVEVDLAGAPDGVLDQELASRLQNRGLQFFRVLHAHGAQASFQSLSERLQQLQVARSTHLPIVHTLRAFGQTISTEPEPATAFLDPQTRTLYVQAADTISWVTVARQLASYLSPETAVAPLASSFTTVILSPSPEAADSDLDALGFTRVDTSILGPAPEAQPVVFDDAESGHQDGTPSPATPTNDGDEETEATSGESRSPVDDRTDADGETCTAGTNGQSGYSGSRRDDETQEGDGSQHLPQRRGQLRSYVYPEGASPSSDDVSPSVTTADNDAVDSAGVKRVLDYERQHGREPKAMDHYHPGYDVESFDEKGRLQRIIEIKSLAGEWDGFGVGISATQFDTARRKEEAFWLYVVEHAKDDELFQVTCIPHPTAHITDYRFDDRWRNLHRED